MNDLIEKVARALSLDDNRHWGDLSGSKIRYRRSGSSFAKVALKALGIGTTHAIVPREPTAAILKVPYAALHYKAMIKAAQEDE